MPKAVDNGKKYETMRYRELKRVERERERERERVQVRCSIR